MRPSFRSTAPLLIALLGCGMYAKSESGYSKENADVASPAPTSPSSGQGALMRTTEGEVAPASETGASGQPTFAADPAAIPAMIIRTGQASLEIDSLEQAVAQVRQLAERVGGYIANSQMQAGVEQLRSATLEIKVPAPRFEELTRGLAPIGKVEYVNVSAEDVGEEFTDVTARAANSRRLESRLIELLATRTGKLSDVLEIERELARVREDIERMEGRLRYLKAHAATSTLSVTVHEKAPIVGQQGSGGVIAEAFRSAWRNFVNFSADGIASLGVLVPTVLLLLLVLYGLRAVWRRRHA